MTATDTDLVIAEAGVYDIPDTAYHRDPVPAGSLSSSGARKLLPPSCPALFRYERDHKRPPRKTFDIGHAAHHLVLGSGPELVCVDRPRWDTSEVKADVAEIRGRGGVPLKADEYAQVQAMAAAIRAHPVAAALLNPECGDAEQSAFWVDDETGIWRRARFDFLRTRARGRVAVVDYKTTVSAAPDKIERSVYDYGYHMQQPYYLDAVAALGLADADAQFVYVFQEKSAPHLITVVQLDEDAVRVGHERNRRAIDIYRRCTETGLWPGYTADVHTVALPAWIERRHEEETAP